MPLLLQTRSVAMLALVAVALIGSCAGRASVHLIPTGPTPIPTAGPLLIELSPKECYFWIDDDGRLLLAMRAHHASLWGSGFEREFILSLVLKKVPAGSARYYRATRRTMRARYRHGLGHTRAASLTGSVLVSDFGTSRMKGRFRIKAKQQSYFVLTGWGRDALVLFVGEFAAVENRIHGERILARTEESGMERLPPGTPIPVLGPPRAAPTEGDGARRNPTESTRPNDR